MLDGMVRLLPTAEVGFLGMIRDEETLQASTYATRLPDDLSGRQCYVLDPMLATGGTLVAAISFLLRPRRATTSPRSACSRRPRGSRSMEQAFGVSTVPVQVVTAGLDEKLNEQRLHRPRPRRRRRPPLRRGLSLTSRRLRAAHR